MKSTYEKRWGHARFRKAVVHLRIKELKRNEAMARNAKYQALTRDEKWERACSATGNCANQKTKLANIRSI